MVDIRVSPERLRSVASQLNGKQQEVDSILNGMISTVSNLQGEWTGMAQVDYANQFDQQVPTMRTNLAEVLENLIQALRHAADVFERADQEAA